MSASAVIDWAVQTGIGLSLLVVIILLIRKPFARRFGASAAYALWALPVIRLVMPQISLPILKPDLPNLSTNVTYMGVDMLPLVTEAATQAVPAKANTEVIILGVWLAGAAAWLMLQFFRQHSYARALYANSRAASGLHNANIDLALHRLGFRAAPHIRIAADNTGPLVTGLRRPMIILPNNFESHFTPPQQHLALIHEMAHIRRLDLWAAFAGLIFRAINWPNPLIHFAARSFRADQEAACDATVLRLTQSPAAIYAQTLMQAAKSAARPRHEAPLGLTIYHPLKERLIMMKTPANTRAGLLSRAAAAALMLSALTLTAPLTLASGPDSPELAGAAKTQSSGKQVIKMVEDVDGVRTESHYEVETTNGKVKAWSIDPWGNKMEVDPDSIQGLDHMIRFQPPLPPLPPEGPLHVEMREFTDDNGTSTVVVKSAVRRGPAFRYDKDGKRVLMKEGEYTEFSDADMEKIIGNAMDSQSKQMVFVDENGDVQFKDYPEGKDIQVITMTSDHAISGDHSEAMIEAATGLLQDVEMNDLSGKARRKVEKARKALKEAQEAINAEK